MKKISIFLAIILNFIPGNGEGIKDIKFYNLEKEYRQTETFVYEVKNADALELKQILSGMLSIYGFLYVNEKTKQIYITDVPEKISDIKNVINNLDISELKAGNNLATKLIYLKHENASEISGIIRHKLSPEGSLFEVPYLNAITITDIPSKISEVETTVKTLDVPGIQILIEITAIEFNNEKFSKIGINLFSLLQGISIRADLHGMNFRDILNSGKFQIRQSNERYLPEEMKNLREEDINKKYHLSTELGIGDLIGYICDNGDGSVLANSKIITRNNKEAIISAREIIPYRFYDNEEAERSTYEGQKAAGIYVRVIPTLQQDSLINLNIFPVISNLTGWSPKGVPIIFERTLSTEVKVKNNSVFVLGGLKKKEIIENRRGIPGLKDVPIIQYLFSIKQKITLEREVLIFIRPSILINNEIENFQIRELIDRFNEIENEKKLKNENKKIK